VQIVDNLGNYPGGFIRESSNVINRELEVKLWRARRGWF
jgi:hypothetical protein